MGAHHDPALLCLPEDSRQAHDGNLLRVDDVAEDIARTDARQLVDVAHEHQTHRHRNGFHQVVHQQDVDHRAFVHDQGVAVQRIFVATLIAVLWIVFQQPVDGLGIHPRRFAHAFGRTSRRRRQQNAQPRLL